MIELKTIQIIKTIEEEGSFQKAADTLYLSQPALSQYIKRVEKELSFDLYERVNGKCILTEAGKILLERGTTLLVQFEEMLDEMQKSLHTNKKSVYFGCPTGYSHIWFSDFLYGMEKFDHTQIRMTEESVECLINMLLRKTMNILFIPAVYFHPDIVYYTIRHEEYYLAVPKNHASDSIIKSKRSDGYADLSDLKEMPFISGPAKAYTEFLRPLFEEAGAVQNVIFVAKNWDIAHALVEKGVGLTIVPFWLVNNESKYVNYYKIKSCHNIYRTFAYALHQSCPVTNEMKEVISHVIDKFGDEFAGQPVDPSSLILNYNTKTSRIYETE